MHPTSGASKAWFCFSGVYFWLFFWAFWDVFFFIIFSFFLGFLSKSKKAFCFFCVFLSSPVWASSFGSFFGVSFFSALGEFFLFLRFGLHFFVLFFWREALKQFFLGV